MRRLLVLGFVLLAAAGFWTLYGPAAIADDDDDGRPAARADHDGDEGEGEDDEDEEDEEEPTVALKRVGPAARGAPTVRYVAGELLARFRADASDAEIRDAVARAEGRIARVMPELGVHVVAVSPARVQRALDSLRSEPVVAGVERDVLLEALDTVPNDALWSTQWGWRLVGAPRAWDSSRGAAAIVIAVADTGVDARHPDLAGATVAGYDVVNNDSDPADDEGHGTGVAGVIAARTNNREGQAGVCWSCSIMPVKVLDATGSGKTSNIATGIVWAVDHGARIINMSFGGPGTTSAMQAAISYAARKGVVLIASAGNSGVDTRFYPAAYDDVLGVAATTETDSRYTWSNYGDWVAVAAPGCNTATAPDARYVDFCGTSSAAPVVSGIAGLALALNPRASKTEIDQAMARSATPTPGVSRFGRVNAPVVVSAVSTGTSTPLQPPAAPPPPPPPPPLPEPPPAAAPPAPPPAVALPAVPANVQAPRLRGLARVGRRVRVSTGVWTGSPEGFEYSWQRCARNGARCRAISRARRQVYTVRRLDRGHRLRALVVAVNPAGRQTARSGASSIVRFPRR